MLALARFTLKGPYQAAAVVGLLAVLAMLLPLSGANLFSVMLALLVSMISVVLVGLIILTQGIVSGLKPVAVAATVVVVAGWLLSNSLEQGISTVVMQWLPLILLAQTLRSTGSMALTLLAGIALGAAGIMLQQLFWVEMESAWLAQFLQRESGAPQATPEQAKQFELVVRMLMLLVVSSLYLVQMLMIFTARWMQARLFESTGFGRDFRALTLGKPAAMAAMIVIGLALWLQQAWMVSLGFLFTIAFMFQGIAIVHSRLGPKKQALPLLVLYYVLLVFMWQIVGVLTAITGMIDNWLVFRKKPAKPGNDNEV